MRYPPVLSKAAPLAALFAALVALLGATMPASASQVKIRYALTLTGLPIGSASINATVDSDAYKLDASAKIGGILALVSDGKGAASSSGRLGTAGPVATGYALNTVSSDKRQTVQMTLAGGRVADVAVTPAASRRADRVPVTDKDKQGVMDPLSALLMPVRGTAPNAAACNRTLPIFDGAARFDVVLRYDRMETVETDTGYSGPAVVCSARYVPIAGHRAKRAQTVFMAENKDLEVWLAPVSGAPVLAPWRIVVGTQVGRLVISAVKFVANDDAVDTMKARSN